MDLQVSLEILRNVFLCDLLVSVSGMPLFSCLIAHLTLS